MTKLILLFLFIVTEGFSQLYILQKTTTLSSSAETITVHSPGTATNPRVIRFKSAYADCANACTITLLRSGVAPTTTSQTPASIQKGATAASALGFNTSNTSGGTTLGVYAVGKGGSITLDLAGLNMELKASSADNVTLKTNSISGVVNMFIIWEEADR